MQGHKPYFSPRGFGLLDEGVPFWRENVQWWVILMVSVAWLAAPVEAGPPLSLDTVREQARVLATKDYRPQPGAELPDFLKKLNYDAYQSLRYRPEQAPWHGEQLRCGVQFFHRGYLFQEPVRIHLLENGQVRDFQFSPDQFDYGIVHPPKPVPAGLDFAGLRVLYAAGGASKQDEVASFVGASYFRLAGLRQSFGAAGRGLAIDTAEPGGEEFPRFTEFWAEKPGAMAGQLEFFALLDSPSAAGAYRFVINPGDITVADVEASLFVRKESKKFGLAPLTSMFLMGANRSRFIPDFRPQVHDSDGLLIQTSKGQWLWRPLINPEKKHQVSHFQVDDLWGFGLLQRDRDFHDYQDLGRRYDLCPSLWVEPRNKWGAGTIELVEIPSPSEGNDNIVAYWLPKEKPAAGKEFRYAYSLSAQLTEPEHSAFLRVQSTRLSPDHDKIPPRFVVDFSGDSSPGQEAKVPLTARLQASHGEVRNLVTQFNEVTRGWRVSFELPGIGSEPSDLRLFLQSGDAAVSETWIYRFP
jgi:periplasmic glucans biosynthesis protein